MPFPFLPKLELVAPSPHILNKIKKFKCSPMVEASIFPPNSNVVPACLCFRVGLTGLTINDVMFVAYFFLNGQWFVPPHQGKCSVMHFFNYMLLLVLYLLNYSWFKLQIKMSSTQYLWWQQKSHLKICYPMLLPKLKMEQANNEIPIENLVCGYQLK